jgi:hypothetical protein
MVGTAARDASLRDLILSEIRRLARRDGGKPPGKNTFARETGITEGKWSGVVWARWSDALSDAGFSANKRQAAYPKEFVVGKLADLCRRYGRQPTRPEIKMERRTDASFPSAGAVHRRFPTTAALTAGLWEIARKPDHADLAALLPLEVESTTAERSAPAEGWVYLLKSGGYYKVGRSDNVKRRLDEIKIAMPENVTLVHAIKTDDPPGIEAYWHKRFEATRANGEWFRLSRSDVRAFTRRSFQ